MEEITVLYDLPIIFTKDAQFVKNFKENKAKHGQIILLPKDAVLAVPPQIMSIEDKK